MCPATLKRKANNLKPLQLDVPLGTWQRIKIAAATSNPPQSQAAYLRMVLASCEPIEVPQTDRADQLGEAG